MSLAAADRRRLRREAQGLDVAVQVGKAGLSEATVAEVARQLKDRSLVKVRILGSADEGSDETFVRRLAEAVGAELVEVRGHTAVLWRARGRRPAQGP